MRNLSTVLFFSFLFSLGLVACRSKERVSGTTSTATYDVVSEGDASGIASTINGPGEMVPPMTSTNVDTTTNLAITGQPAVPTATNGNLAEALPTMTAAPGNPVYTPAPNPPVGIMRRTPIPATQTSPPLATRPAPAQPVPPTETAPPIDTPPLPTDTASSPTDTAPPSPPPPPPEQTDTTPTNPGR